MKKILFGIFFLSQSFVSTSGAATTEQVTAKLQSLTGYFSSDNELKSVGTAKYWEGQQELHPVWDLFFYVALQKTGKATAQLRDETLSRLFDSKWRTPDGAWLPTPGSSKADFDITAAIVVTLNRATTNDPNTSLEIQKNDSRVQNAWNWLNAKYQFGGNDKDVMRMNVLFRIFMTVVGVLPRTAAPLFPVNLLGMPKGYPMSPVDLGVFRTVMIPLCVWDFYHGFRPIVTKLDQERLNSRGSQLGKISNKSLAGLLFNDIDGFLDALHIQHSWDGFTTFVENLAAPGQHNWWAQEGLGYLLSRKQEGNTWYVLGSSLVTLMALQAAHDKVVFADPLNLLAVGQPIDGDSGLLAKNISDLADGMIAWRNLGSSPVTLADGTIANIHFIPAARSPIWDSSLALQNLNSLPTALLSPLQNTVNSVRNWLGQSYTENKGDWEYWRDPSQQLEEGSYAAWAFYPEAIWHPDTDDSASVMESLLLSSPNSDLTQKGLRWILSSQNQDGGFPAWEKGTSKLSNDIMQKLLVGFPRVADFSQPDVSSRIQRMLLNARDKGQFDRTELDAAINNNCNYIKAAKDPKNTNNPQLWEGDWIVDYTYGTSEVLHSLLETSRVFPQCWDMGSASAYMDWFKSIQKADGGWGESQEAYNVRNYVEADNSSVLQTTYVMKALLSYERLFRENLKKQNQEVVPSPYFPTIQKGVDYLLSNIQADGRVKEKSFTGVYIKGVIFSDYTLMPEYHTIGVLGEYLQL